MASNGGKRAQKWLLKVREKAAWQPLSIHEKSRLGHATRAYQLCFYPSKDHGGKRLNLNRPAVDRDKSLWGGDIDHENLQKVSAMDVSVGSGGQYSRGN